MTLLASALAAVMALGACHPDTAPAATAQRPVRVVMFGDSIAVETATYLKPALEARKMVVTTQVRGGTAPCDWLSEYRALVRAGQVDEVTVFFNGNRMTPCTRPNGTLPSDDESIAMYRRDVGEMVRTAVRAGARVRVVLPAPFDRSRWPQMASFNRRIGPEVYQPLAARYSFAVETVSLAPALGTRFHEQDDCRADETAMCDADGLVTIRTNDGLHLCPADSKTFTANQGNCPVPSPGASRVARIIAGSL